MKIPLRYVCEMVCDRVAASQVYLGDRYTDAAAWEYYERSKDHYILHPETRALEKLLKMVRDKGRQRTFAYIPCAAGLRNGLLTGESLRFIREIPAFREKAGQNCLFGPCICTGRFCVWGRTLSVACGDSSPKGEPWQRGKSHPYRSTTRRI